jgi:hypothetical protein
MACKLLILRSRLFHPDRLLADCVTRQAENSIKIQFLLVHVSVKTTERYIGCPQRLRNAVNDQIGSSPNCPPSVIVADSPFLTRRSRNQIGKSVTMREWASNY